MHTAGIFTIQYLHDLELFLAIGSDRSAPSDGTICETDLSLASAPVDTVNLIERECGAIDAKHLGAADIGEDLYYLIFEIVAALIVVLVVLIVGWQEIASLKHKVLGSAEIAHLLEELLDLGHHLQQPNAMLFEPSISLLFGMEEMSVLLNGIEVFAIAISVVKHFTFLHVE